MDEGKGSALSSWHSFRIFHFSFRALFSFLSFSAKVSVDPSLDVG